MKSIQQITVESENLEEVLNGLAKRDDVFIIYNVYGIMTQMYVHLKREEDAKNIKPENCIRIKPFKDYWEKNHGKPFFKENMYMALSNGREMLVSIT